MGKLGATGLAIGGAGAVGSQTMVGEAEAILPAVLGAAAGGVAINETYQFLDDWTGWNGADDPPEGMSADVLEERVYSSTRKRQSDNASTFVDNGNIIDGTEHVAWADAKLAAIEALNNEESQQACIDAGQTAVDDYETTIKTNLLKSWNASVSELENLVQAVESHSDVSLTDVFSWYFPSEDWGNALTGISIVTTSLSMPDGSSFDLKRIELTDEASNTKTWGPSSFSGDNPSLSSGDGAIQVSIGEGVLYLAHDDWNAVWSAIETNCQNVRDGIVTWVEGVYSQVQAGDISTGELLTPREIAELTAEEESQFNQAMADLMALNVPVNMDREAEVHLSSIGATLYGHLGVTGGGELTTGTIDPSADEQDYYLTYDVSEAHGDWGAFNTAVDGGVVTFTEEPHPETLYTINTGADETAEVHSDDFVQDGENWTVEISGQVESAITEVSSVEFYAPDGESESVTVLLEEQFEIVTFRDTETDEEHESATYEEPQTPQDDENYMSQEEWEDERDRLQGLIDDYKDSQNGGGGAWLPDIGIPDVGGMFTGVFVLVGGVYVLGKALGGSGNN